MGRLSKEVLYLRREFTDAERLEMGTQLAESHNALAAIQDEEAVMKAQIKDRKAGVEQKIGTLSRNLSAGFTMENVETRLEWDTPNPFEVSYIRTDNGETVRTRPMTDAERQIELPLQSEGAAEPSPDAVQDSVEASQAAADEFFGKDEAAPKPEVENLAAQFDHDEESDEELDEDEGEEETEPEESDPEPVKRGRGRPKGSTNKPRSPEGFSKPVHPGF